MNAEELRAMTAQGPTTVLVDRRDMLRMIDDNADMVARNDVLERRNRALCIFSIGATSLWLWHVIVGLAQWLGAP